MSTCDSLVTYWVNAARENHRWALQDRCQPRATGRQGAAQRRKSLASLRARRSACMAKARQMRDVVLRLKADRAAQLAALPGGIVPALTVGGRVVLASGEERL